MKARFTLLILLLQASTSILLAQDQAENNSFEQWKGGQFKCCGNSLKSPVWWSITEHPMQMAYNHFVYPEPGPALAHTGNYAVRLHTDTTTLDSAGDLTGNTSVWVPGTVVGIGIVCYGKMFFQGDPYKITAQSQGWPFSGNPLFMNFYMKITHAVLDTPQYAYVLTRWNTSSMKEDTLALSQQKLPD